jgi:hypothetical protein
MINPVSFQFSSFNPNEHTSLLEPIEPLFVFSAPASVPISVNLSGHRVRVQKLEKSLPLNFNRLIKECILTKNLSQATFLLEKELREGNSKLAKDRLFDVLIECEDQTEEFLISILELAFKNHSLVKFYQLCL